MKALLFIATCLLLITACSKSSVTPDAGNVVAGTYNILTDRLDTNAVTLYNDTYPETLPGGGTATGILVARRDSATVVYLTETFKATGYPDQPVDLGQVSLKSNGAGYDMYVQSLKVGTADGTNINIDYQYRSTLKGPLVHVTTTAKR